MAREEYGITVDEAVSTLRTEIEHGVNFMFSEFGEEWERAERYFAGETDLIAEEGRSRVVKTEFRDALRAAKPSILRTLLHARKIVEYIPKNMRQAAFVEQQAEYVTSRFWECGGYKALVSIIEEAGKKKACPIKTYWMEDPSPEFARATGMTAEEISALDEQPDIDIIDITEEEVPLEGEPQYYTVEWEKFYPNGKVMMEPFSITEFFFSKNVTYFQDGPHGHRRNVTVSEALEMGLDYDEWHKLDSDDPETNQHQGESYERRGYQKDTDNDMENDDLANHQFLLTECYCEFDLEGTGRLQKYIFFLGGTTYQYLDHQRIEDWEIDLAEIDPVAFAVLGRSYADVTMNEQDMNTSILRAITDNFHMANNPRFAANPMMTDFNDLMNNRIGGPIKDKSQGGIQVIDIPFTGQQGLPLLQYLEQDVQNKTGVTKAAQGLDPDAMQSTDKEAVRNTIALSQGQVEFAVRNLVETGLIPVFRKMLRLSIRHMDRLHPMRTKGMIIPVDIHQFDPDLIAEPKVGLGTGTPEQKLQTMLWMYQEQQTTIKEFGLDNPFVSLTQVYNLREDIAELGGITNVGRYFNMVTPQMEQKLAEQREKAIKEQQKLQAENMPMDPSKAAMAIEGGKARVKMYEIDSQREYNSKTLSLDAIRLQEESDYKRDELVQRRVIDLEKIKEAREKTAIEAKIKREQQRNDRLNRMNNAINETSE